jgi:hypothetical protein
MSTKKWNTGAGIAAAWSATASTSGPAPQQAGDVNGQQVKIMVGDLNIQLSDEPAGVDAETNRRHIGAAERVPAIRHDRAKQRRFTTVVRTSRVCI